MSSGNYIATALGVALLALPVTTHSQEDRGLVWSLAGKTNTVYLAGSIHLLREADHPLPSSYERAFEDSRVMVVEVDEKQMSDPKALQNMMKRATCAKGKTTRDYLSDETLELIGTVGGSAEQTIQAMSAYQPWFIATAMTLTELSQMEVTPGHGAESHFSRRAEETGKPVESLETVEEQIDLLAGMTPAQQDIFLRATIQEMGNIQKDFDKLIRLWKQGDAEELDRMLNRQLSQFPDIQHRLLTRRNLNWLKVIREDYLQRAENIFILVGSAHLIGDKGLVTLLEAEGGRLKRVPSNSTAGQPLP
jgi:uncharacterized protein YbaP (TraB family)